MRNKPKYINMYFATHKTCNLNCSYCYVPEYNKKNRREDDGIILESLKRFINKVESEDYRIGSFCLHGSEPTLMEPVTMLETIKLINAHWQKYETEGLNMALQSNGIRLTRDYLGYLKERLDSPKALRLGFSIDPPKETHDLYRNNSFDKVEQNYYNAIDMGFPVSVLAVVTGETMKYLIEFMAWMKKQLEMKRKFGNPYRVKIKFATGDLALTEEQIKEFSEFLFRNEALELIQILTPGYCILEGNECMWFEFDINGACYSCNKAYMDEGIFADWNKESFGQIFEKRKSLYAGTIRSDECSECEYEFLCNSGCPIDRYKTGAMAGKAHECSLIKYVYRALDEKGIHITEFLNNNN